jgi:hypothetical protein
MTDISLAPVSDRISVKLNAQPAPPDTKMVTASETRAMLDWRHCRIGTRFNVWGEDIKERGRTSGRMLCRTPE